MARGIFKITTALLAMSACVSAAQAGGFSRGTADTDLIYEDGNFNIRAGVTIVSPTRKYTQAFAPLGGTLVGTDYADTYVIPSAALKLNVTDDLRCAGTVAQPYGGSTTYAVAIGPSAKLHESFATTEAGLTCGYKFDLAKGQVWLLGGVFNESFNYDLTAGGGAIKVRLGANDWGYRLGAAYTIPEIALKAELMYRAGTQYDATGTTTRLGPTGTGLDAALPLGVAAPVASGNGSLPQSVELKLQSGIAPGWLAFGSVKWTDWSVTQSLDLFLAPGVLRQNLYNWRDGWTVTAGVGHAFNEKLSGAVSLTYDRGVGTGFDLSSTTWTLGAGGSYKDDMGGELRFGGGVTYIAAAAEDKYTPAQGGNSAVKAGWALATGASYKVKW